jgi:hypothetical protein
MRTQMGMAVNDYVSNIPNMSAYELGHDGGFLFEKVLEIALVSRGTSLTVNAVRGSGIISKSSTPSIGSLKNLSGSLDDAANLARNQPYGPINNIYRRLPKSPQDVLALEGAQAGKGRMIIKSLSDPRYKGWEKWHYSVGPKGSKSIVHYIRNPKTGYLTDFKFK